MYMKNLQQGFLAICSIQSVLYLCAPVCANANANANVAQWVSVSVVASQGWVYPDIGYGETAEEAMKASDNFCLEDGQGPCRAIAHASSCIAVATNRNFEVVAGADLDSCELEKAQAIAISQCNQLYGSESGCRIWFNACPDKTFPPELKDPLALRPPAPPRPRSQFVEVTKQVGLAGIDAQTFAWSDFNNDGNVDLLADNRLFQNIKNKNGYSFVEVTDAVGLKGMTGRGIFADIDGDGRLDIITSTGQLWLQIKPDHFVESSAKYGLKFCPQVGAIAVGEFQKNGRLDVITLLTETASADGENFTAYPPQFFRNNGVAGFTEVGSQLGFEQYPGYGRGVNVADFNNDGNLDFYFSYYRLRANPLFMGGAGNTFKEVGKQQGVWGEYDTHTYQDPRYGKIEGPDYGHTIGSTWVDLNNDGNWDLWVSKLAHKWIGGKDNRGYYCDDSKIYRNTGAPDYSFVDMRDESGIPRLPISGDATYKGQDLWGGAMGADFDNDGLIDVFVPQVYDLPFAHSFLFHNKGSFQFEEVGQHAGVQVWNTYGAAWADYNNDGNMDLVTAGESEYQGKNSIHMWKNTGTGTKNEFIRFKLVGVRSNRAAIGARVTLHFDDGTLMMRQVEGGTGSLNQQNDPTIHFGLGQGRVIDHVDIDWPSGIHQRLPHKKKNRLYRIVERLAVMSPARK